MDKLSRFDFSGDEMQAEMLIDINKILLAVVKNNQNDIGSDDELEKIFLSVMKSSKTGRYLDDDDEDTKSYLSKILEYAKTSLEKYSQLSEAEKKEMLVLLNEVISQQNVVLINNTEEPLEASDNDIKFADYVPATQHLRTERAVVETSDGVLRLKYDSPIFYNSQWTYQRFFINNEGSRSVYELTKNISDRTGGAIKMGDDPAFGKYVESIDGIKDGQDGMYWEFWIVDRDTGEKRIGDLSIDQQVVKKNEFVEWRLAEEQEYGCGGGGGDDREKFVASYFNNNSSAFTLMQYARPGSAPGINLAY